MDLYEAIHNRRSHRLYRPEMPPRDALERVVDAGLWAPSGMNTQCWDIAVLAGQARDELVSLINLSLKELVPIMQQAGVTETSQQRVAAFFKNLGGAPVVMAVTIWKWDAPGAGNFQSGAALLQNMLLAAHAEGLGTCWMTAGSLVEKEVLEFLGKTDQTLLAITPIGYSAKQPPVVPRKPRDVRWLGF
jgi:nitroreductase